MCKCVSEILYIPTFILQQCNRTRKLKFREMSHIVGKKRWSKHEPCLDDSRQCAHIAY